MLNLKMLNAVKPAHAVTSIKQSLVLKGHNKFPMNWTSFRRSPVLQRHFFYAPKLTS